MADETFLEFYNQRRNRGAFTDKVMDAESRLKLVGAGDNPNTPEDEGSGDHWTFGRYEFDIAENVRGARELVAAYAIYVKRQTIAGDEVGEFVRPTVDNA
jgi:hypothetical protein